MARCTVRVEIDEAALKQAVKEGEGVQALLKQKTDEIVSRANSLASGMRTGLFYDREQGQLVGNTQPEYTGNVEKRGNGYIGIVHPANYAAMKANYESNILLKAKG